MTAPRRAAERSLSPPHPLLFLFATGPAEMSRAGSGVGQCPPPGEAEGAGGARRKGRCSDRVCRSGWVHYKHEHVHGSWPCMSMSRVRPLRQTRFHLQRSPLTPSRSPRPFQSFSNRSSCLSPSLTHQSLSPGLWSVHVGMLRTCHPSSVGDG